MLKDFVEKRRNSEDFYREVQSETSVAILILIKTLRDAGHNNKEIIQRIEALCHKLVSKCPESALMFFSEVENRAYRKKNNVPRS